jgi:hypothetical protein
MFAVIIARAKSAKPMHTVFVADKFLIVSIFLSPSCRGAFADVLAWGKRLLVGMK